MDNPIQAPVELLSYAIAPWKLPAHFLDALFRRCLIITQLMPARLTPQVVAKPSPGGQQTKVMADLKFACSHCGQDIQCDELWSGHEIQCPNCQGQLIVPPKPEAPPHANLAAAKPGAPRLSIGQSRAEISAAPKAVAPQVAAYEKKLSQNRAAGTGAAKKWVTIGAVVVILGVGGYFGFTYWQGKKEEAAKQASEAAAQQAAAAKAAEEAAAVAAAPPKQEVPQPPVWTLDVDKAKIPNSRVNGSISGTNFLAETSMCTAQVLRLLQGSAASPDREILVYLHLNPGQSPTGHTWTVSQTMKDRSVPQVVKRWKTNPKFAPLSKPYSSGYAMKLELGQPTNGLLPGKIFVALPDTEQTVVAGTFQATTTLGEPIDPNAASSVVTPNPMAMPPGPNPGQKAAFDRRYGGKR
jgi:DNA-directed RNA polymerase subunit RPC12/RpoP